MAHHDHDHDHDHKHCGHCGHEGDKKDLQKLKVLLPHWIKHNLEHIQSHEKWLDTLKNQGLAEVADDIEKAVETLKQTNELFESAKKKMEKV